jgi:hypothetical protein
MVKRYRNTNDILGVDPLSVSSIQSIIDDVMMCQSYSFWITSGPGCVLDICIIGILDETLSFMHLIKVDIIGEFEHIVPSQHSFMSLVTQVDNVIKVWILLTLNL